MHRTTARLVLRKPNADDLESLFAIYGDPATNQFNPSGPLRDIGQAQALLHVWLQHWEKKGYGQWAISTCNASQKLIGFGGLDARMYVDVERLNLGYRFAATAWGKGYATELSEAALRFGFEELGLHEVFAVVRPNHVASIRVLEKIGMQRVDTLNDVPGQPPSLVFKARRSLPEEDKQV
ncbi:GNAT family N-acetyltransferase [Pseudomonas syringae]|uniref:GNAT family acetyltraansferase n=1 Tax=Pseudomonas syringae TaxID=317 RepID=A0A085VGG6_PSESX|nr:GNAT family N-acetyltransferase [Pseudomonas syringae]KFE54529.1 GNAT family acetyltraansferase [Pseudomonas syringae]